MKKRNGNNNTELVIGIGAVCFIVGMAVMYLWLMANGQIVALL